MCNEDQREIAQLAAIMFVTCKRSPSKESREQVLKECVADAILLRRIVLESGTNS